MNNRSGTGKSWWICAWQTLHFHLPCGRTTLSNWSEKTSWPQAWNCDVKPKICQLMLTYFWERLCQSSSQS